MEVIYKLLKAGVECNLRTGNIRDKYYELGCISMARMLHAITDEQRIELTNYLMGEQYLKDMEKLWELIQQPDFADKIKQRSSTK